MINCPICNKSAGLLVDKAKDYFILKGDSPDFQIFYCALCQIASSQPYLNDKELASYYPEEYEAYVPKKSFAAFLQVLKYKSDLRLIKKRVAKKDASLFEVGAGRGEFLAQAKNFGFSVSGIEPSQVGRQAAKDLFNIELLGGYANELKFKEKYDVIVMRHALEHINEPAQVLEKIKAGLADDGILFLKLPRLDSWEAKFFKKYWDGYDLPRHRFHYSTKGIEKLLRVLGFSQVEIIGEAVPIAIIRSMRYYSADQNDSYSKLFRLFLFLPKAVQLVLAQLIAVVQLPFKSGRMIVITR